MLACLTGPEAMCSTASRPSVAMRAPISDALPGADQAQGLCVLLLLLLLCAAGAGVLFRRSFGHEAMVRQNVRLPVAVGRLGFNSQTV